MKEILRSDRLMYSLSETDRGGMTLAVVCGGIAMYTVELDLTEDEIHRFRREGESFVDGLALKVCKNWPGLEGRLRR